MLDIENIEKIERNNYESIKTKSIFFTNPEPTKKNEDISNLTIEQILANYNLNNKKCLATLAETLVASSLYKLKLLRHNFIGLFYDPKKSGVDFLVRNIDKIIPIEVGVGKKTKSQLTKAINNYNSDYGILISNRTFSIKKENNIIYIPLRTFSYI